jgi:hypothetical protein
VGETLLASCGKGMLHDPNTKNGECATANGTVSFGKLHTPDHIVCRFVEREDHWQPPQSNQFMQVLWKSTEYVGSAGASKSIANGEMCHTQVCQYLRPGKEMTILLFLQHSSRSLLNVMFPVI